MKKILTITFFLVVSYYNANSQPIHYSYDDAGDRIYKSSPVFSSLNYKFFNAASFADLFNSPYYYMKVGVVNGDAWLVLNTADAYGRIIDETVLSWNQSTSPVKVTLYINHLTDPNKYLVLDVSRTFTGSSSTWWSFYQIISAGPTPLANNDNVRLTYTTH